MEWWPNLKSRPITERITMAKVDMTMLLHVSCSCGWMWDEAGWGGRRTMTMPGRRLRQASFGGFGCEEVEVEGRG